MNVPAASMGKVESDPDLSAWTSPTRAAMTLGSPQGLRLDPIGVRCADREVTRTGHPPDDLHVVTRAGRK